MKQMHLLRAACISLLLAGSTTLVSAQNQSLSDPEVAYVAVTANQIDIDYAQIAKQKSKNAEIVKFAETMERDHKGVIAQASDLVKKLNVTPKDNAVAQKLQSDADKTKQQLKGVSGAEFDKSYIDNEVAYHKAVINAVETVLIPEVQNAELKKLLQDVLPALRAHLGHAEMVQKNIKQN